MVAASTARHQRPLPPRGPRQRRGRLRCSKSWATTARIIATRPTSISQEINPSETTNGPMWKGSGAAVARATSIPWAESASAVHMAAPSRRGPPSPARANPWPATGPATCRQGPRPPAWRSSRATGSLEEIETRDVPGDGQQPARRVDQCGQRQDEPDQTRAIAAPIKAGHLGKSQDERDQSEIEMGFHLVGRRTELRVPTRGIRLTIGLRRVPVPGAKDRRPIPNGDRPVREVVLLSGASRLNRLSSQVGAICNADKANAQTSAATEVRRRFSVASGLGSRLAAIEKQAQGHVRDERDLRQKGDVEMAGQQLQREDAAQGEDKAKAGRVEKPLGTPEGRRHPGPAQNGPFPTRPRREPAVDVNQRSNPAAQRESASERAYNQVKTNASR